VSRCKECIKYYHFYTNNLECGIISLPFLFCLRFWYIRDSVGLFSESAMTLGSSGPQTEPIDRRISEIQHSVPDPEQGRYCKLCKSWKPVKNFPSGKRRYCCKLHRWDRSGKLAKRKHMATGENKLLFGLWIKVYSDSKWFNPVWKNTPTNLGSSHTAMRVNISHGEIKQLLTSMVKTFNVASTMCHDLVELSKHTAIVPISPTEIVSLENAALVPSAVKRQLFKAFRSDGIEGYTRALSMAEAQTNVVFRPTTEQLCEMHEMLVSKNKTLVLKI